MQSCLHANRIGGLELAFWTVLCTAKSGTPKNFGLTLDTDNDTRTVGGPATSRLFKTKTGRYDHHVLPTIGTTLVPASGSTVVAVLDGLTATSSKGDAGNGKQHETAIDFTWVLDSK